MSCSYIVESQDKEKDNTLIILYKDDKTLQVDQQTLQNVILNETDAEVAVVRLSQSNEETTLTVDPPASELEIQANVSAGPTPNAEAPPGLTEHDWMLDPESMEQMENVLRSQRAREVLGDNVAAMLDMLSVEDEQNALRRCIALDHCYTNLTSTGDPKPNNQLVDANSHLSDEPQLSQQQTLSINSNTAASLIKPKIPSRPQTNLTQSRRSSGANFVNSVKTPPVKNASNLSVSEKESPGAQSKDELDDDESLTESSSESEPSDDDYDFGPRGPRRGGIRSRGGRKGLNTRGGSTSSKRRGGNKQLDSEQARRLDMEMAAAVNAMKGSDKEDKKPDKMALAPARGRKIRTMGGKKKDDVPKSEPPPPPERPLQTTNEVKAQLISANMIKGDMIITKPGENRNNQKVMFVQKHVIMKANELKSLGLKKPVVVSKGKVVNQVAVKSPVPVKEQQIKPPVVCPKEPVKPVGSTHGQPKIISVVHLPVQAHLNLGQKTIGMKVKIPEVKKSRRKSESGTSETPVPVNEPESEKPVEVKTPETPVVKKHVKKEHRKPSLPEAFGPELFSTPDIIRRVGGGTELKSPEQPTSPTISTATSNPKVAATPASGPVKGSNPTPAGENVQSLEALAEAVQTTATPQAAPIDTTVNIQPAPIATPMGVEPVDFGSTNASKNPIEKALELTLESQLQMSIEESPGAQEKPPIENKPPTADELQPSLDPGRFKKVKIDINNSCLVKVVNGKYYAYSLPKQKIPRNFIKIVRKKD